MAALPPLVIASPAMLELIAAIELMRESSAPALITGETGAGKELISRAVHALSARCERQFVTLDCAEVSHGLIESELFGHRRGSFTGAISDRKGVIREADGGTLFLDEIGELSPETQKKFLRFLQEREVRPVGADRPVKTDVRVIAATNRDPESEVRAGRFRADLYERLNALRLRVPPLRERREDLPPLIEHFLECYQQEQGEQGLRLSDEAWALLFSYDWPRNVRQLANEIYRLVVLSGSEEVIGAAALSPEIRSQSERQSARPAEVVEGRVVIDLSLPLREAMDEMERVFIINALERTGGNLSRAAASLQMSRNGLKNAIERLRIEFGSEVHPPVQ
jgi:DNA-binding NtrC family response regulator